MGISLLNTPLSEARYEEYIGLITECGLRDEQDADVIAWMTDDHGSLVATGALAGHTVKQLAVSPNAEGQGLMASVLSALIVEAADRELFRLFLCTKPDNVQMFGSMGFYKVVETADAVLMENRKAGAKKYISSLPTHDGTKGAVVCNCDPFTLGHRHLIEYAASRCDWLYVFAVSESGSMFSPKERLDMIKRGTADIPNCIVLESDLYLISRATFPAYFIKDKVQAETVKADLDIEFFAGQLAPALGITNRFVGEEPTDSVTRAYNERLKELLPMRGITLEEIPRFTIGDKGAEPVDEKCNNKFAVSAGKVRAMVRELEENTQADILSDEKNDPTDEKGREERECIIGKIREMVPETTYETICSHIGTGAGRP